MKRCTKCGQDKPLDDFADRSERGAGAKKSRCRECLAQAQKDRRKANLDEVREYERAWRAANSEKVWASQKRWRDNNRETYNDTVKRWRRRHPDRYSEARDRYRASRSQAETLDVSRAEIDRIRASACFVCGTRDEIQVDHIVPLSRGGRHSIGNLQPLCAKHNAQKGAKLLVEFRRYLREVS